MTGDYMKGNPNAAFLVRREAIKDKNSLRVMFYLYHYNPNVRFETMREQLGIEEDVLVHILTVLQNVDIVKFNKEEEMFELSSYGRKTVDNLKVLI